MVPLLLSFILMVMMEQQLRYLLLSVGTLSSVHLSSEAADEDSDENTDDTDVFKLYEQDKCLLQIDFTINKGENRLKSYHSTFKFVSIESIVGAIDAPPPEFAA